MTIWVNKRTGATRNQYNQPSPAHEWERKREYSSSSDSFTSNPALDVLGIAVATGMFDSSPSYSPSSDSFSGGGGDFGGGGSSGSWD